MLYILVLDRGFVVVGHAELYQELAFTWKVRGRTVRRWGTVRGLAQLCDGPTSETILDDSCERLIPFRSVIEMLVVTPAGEKAWAESLGRENQPSPRARR